MSFLGGPRNNGPTGGINADKMEIAIAEMDSITDFFSRMVSTCHNKCIGQRFTDPDLNKGEQVCIDRCVGKYVDVHKKVGEKLNSKGNAAAAAAGGGIGTLS